MTKQNTLSLNQTNMVQLAYMLNDAEFGKMLDEQCKIVVTYSKANLQTIEYIKALYKRLRREAEAVIEAISFEEIVDRTNKMFKTHERLMQVNEGIIEGIKNDVDVQDAFNKHVKELTVYMETRRSDFEEIAEFYKTL
nr:MAG TPA: hypothetical protein [Caudoviricetes sp.]